MRRSLSVVLFFFAAALWLGAENTLTKNGQTIVFYDDSKTEVARQTLDQDGNVASTTGIVPEGRIAEYDDSGKLSAEYQYKGGIIDGLVRQFYSSGATYSEENYVNGKIEGIGKYYFESAKPMAVLTYKAGQREGSAKVYTEGGKLQWETTYKAGSLDGKFTRYYDNAKPCVVESYTEGKLVDRKVFDYRGAAVKGKVVSLYKANPADAIPQSVMEYGGGKFITLSKLTLSAGGMSGSVQCDTVQDLDFTLAIFFATKTGVVAVYKDTERELTAADADGSGVTPLFGTRGFTVKGKGRSVTLSFSVNASTGDVYDLDGVAKTVSVFCLDGLVDPHSLPGGEDGVLAGISNVLSKDVK